MRFPVRTLAACVTVGATAGYAQAGIVVIDKSIDNTLLLVSLASLFLCPLFGVLILAFAGVHRRRAQRQQENRP